MTIKKQWLLVLLVTVFLSVIVNALVFSFLMNKNFVDYSKASYEAHIDQLTSLSKAVLLDNDYSKRQINLHLASHLSDPIKDIMLFDKSGALLGFASSTTHHMMGGRMANRVLSNALEESDWIDLYDGDLLLGKLSVTRYSSVEGSIEAREFALSIIGSAILSLGIVLVMVLILGFMISNKMSESLRHTAKQAAGIELGEDIRISPSGVKEIRMIHQSLYALQSRLKLKQASRKVLIDELLHQTRTPIAILKTHFEAFSDGIINFSNDELKTCEAQIENLSNIITNMGGLIDGEREIETLQMETFDVKALLSQIVSGLKVQFDKKSIFLELDGKEKCRIKADRYKLSQAIYNILTNAYKFTEPEGKVLISYEQNETFLQIKIEDTGTGMTEEEQAKAFDAYYRGNPSSGLPGEGIGLYVAKSNLEQMNGTITLRSKKGLGSEFLIIVPKA